MIPIPNQAHIPNQTQIPIIVNIPTSAKKVLVTIKVDPLSVPRSTPAEQSSVSNRHCINYTTATVLPESRGKMQQASVSNIRCMNHTTATVLPGQRRRKKQEAPGVAEKAANEFMEIWKTTKGLAEVESLTESEVESFRELEVESFKELEVDAFREFYNKKNGTHIANSTIARLVRIKKTQVAIERMLKTVAAQQGLSVQEVNKANTALEREIENLEAAKSSAKREKGVVENARKVLWNVQKLLDREVTEVARGIAIDNAAQKFSDQQKIDPLLKGKEFLNHYSLSFKNFQTAIKNHRLQNEQRNSTSVSTADDLEPPQKRARIIPTIQRVQPIAILTTSATTSTEDLPLDLSLKKTSASTSN